MCTPHGPSNAKEPTQIQTVVTAFPSKTQTDPLTVPEIPFMEIQHQQKADLWPERNLNPKILSPRKLKCPTSCVFCYANAAVVKLILGSQFFLLLRTSSSLQANKTTHILLKCILPLCSLFARVFFYVYNITLYLNNVINVNTSGKGGKKYLRSSCGKQ